MCNVTSRQMLDAAKPSTQTLRECISQLAFAAKTRDGLSVRVINDMVHQKLLPALRDVAVSNSSSTPASESRQNMVTWLRHLYTLLLQACHPTNKAELCAVQSLIKELTQSCAVGEAAGRVLDAFVLHFLQCYAKNVARPLPDLVPLLLGSKPLLSDELSAALACIASATEDDVSASTMARTRAAAVRFICEGLAEGMPLCVLCAEATRSHLVFNSIEDGSPWRGGRDGTTSSGEGGTEGVLQNFTNIFYVQAAYADCAQVLASVLLAACMRVPVWVTYNPVDDVMRCAATTSFDGLPKTDKLHEDVSAAHPTTTRIAVPIDQFSSKGDADTALALAINLFYSVLIAPIRSVSAQGDGDDGCQRGEEGKYSDSNVVRRISLRGILLALPRAGRTTELVDVLRRSGAQSLLRPALAVCSPLADNAAWLQHAAQALTVSDRLQLRNSLCVLGTADDLLHDVCRALYDNILRSEDDIVATASMLATMQAALCESLSVEFCVAAAVAALVAATDCLISAQHNYGVAVMRTLLARSSAPAARGARRARMVQCAARRLARWRRLRVMWTLLHDLNVPYSISDIASSYLTCVNRSLSARRVKQTVLRDVAAARDGSAVTQALVTCFRVFLLVSYSMRVEENMTADASFTLAETHQVTAPRRATNGFMSEKDRDPPLRHAMQALQGLRASVNGTPYHEWLRWSYLQMLHPLCAAAAQQSEAYVTCLQRLLELAGVERGTTLAGMKQLYYGLVDQVKTAHGPSHPRRRGGDANGEAMLHELDALEAKLSSQLMSSHADADHATSNITRVTFVFADTTTSTRPLWPQPHVLPERRYLIDTDWLNTLSGLEHVPSLLQEAVTQLVDGIVRSKVSVVALEQATTRTRGDTLDTQTWTTSMKATRSPLSVAGASGGAMRNTVTPAAEDVVVVATDTVSTPLPVLSPSSATRTPRRVGTSAVSWWWQDMQPGAASSTSRDDTNPTSASSDTATSYTTATSVDAGAANVPLNYAVPPKGNSYRGSRLPRSTHHKSDKSQHPRLFSTGRVARTIRSLSFSISSDTLTATSCTTTPRRHGVRLSRAVRRDCSSRKRCHCCHSHTARTPCGLASAYDENMADRMKVDVPGQRCGVPSLLRFSRVLQPPRGVRGVARRTSAMPSAPPPADVPPSLPTPTTAFASATRRQTHSQPPSELMLLTLTHGTGRARSPVVLSDAWPCNGHSDGAAPQAEEDTVGLRSVPAARRCTPETPALSSSTSLLRPVFANTTTQPPWCTAMRRLQPPPLPCSAVLQSPPPLLHLAASRAADSAGVTRTIDNAPVAPATVTTSFTITSPPLAHSPASAPHARTEREGLSGTTPSTASATATRARVSHVTVPQVVLTSSVPSQPPPAPTLENTTTAATDIPSPVPPRILPVVPAKPAILNPDELAAFHQYTAALKSRHDMATSALVPGVEQSRQTNPTDKSGPTPSRVHLVPRLPVDEHGVQESINAKVSRSPIPSLAVPVPFPHPPLLSVTAASATAPVGVGEGGSRFTVAETRQPDTHCIQSSPPPLTSTVQPKQDSESTQQAKLVSDIVAQKDELLRLNRQLIELQLNAARNGSAIVPSTTTSLPMPGMAAPNALPGELPPSSPPALSPGASTRKHHVPHDMAHDTTVTPVTPAAMLGTAVDALANAHHLPRPSTSRNTSATAIEHAVEATRKVVTQYDDAVSGIGLSARQEQVMLDAMRYRTAMAERDLREMQSSSVMGAADGLVPARGPTVATRDVWNADKSAATRVIASYTTNITSEEEGDAEEGMSTSSSESTVVQIASLMADALPRPLPQRDILHEKQQQVGAARRVSFRDSPYESCDPTSAVTAKAAQPAQSTRVQAEDTARQALGLDTLYQQAPRSLLTWSAAMKLSGSGRGCSASTRGGVGHSTSARLRSVSATQPRSNSARRFAMYTPQARRCGAKTMESPPANSTTVSSNAAPSRRRTTTPHRTVDDRFVARQSQRREANTARRIALLEREFT